MPQYSWKGLDAQKVDRYGILLARNTDQLEKVLRAENITLVAARQTKITAYRSVNRFVLGSLCEHMNSLLQAGLRVDESLELVAKTIDHALLKFIVADSAQAIREGVSLSSVFNEHAAWLDRLLITLVGAGEEAGSLQKAFKTLELHYKAQEELSKKLRSALAMPLLTLLFFVIIALCIFLAVIPRFESLFAVINKRVPPVTQFLFNVSSFLKNNGMLLGVMLAISVGACVYVVRSLRFKKKMDRIIVTMPLVGKVVQLYALTLFLQTLAVLLEGGVHLVKAIDLASQTVGNSYLRQSFAQIARDVERGVPLSSALALYPSIHALDIESLCAMGEASGALGSMIHKAAQLYHSKTYSYLSLITTLIPPLLLVLLGGIIGMLIFAVYTPLLSMSWVIG